MTMNYQVITESGEILGESPEYTGAKRIQEWYLTKGLDCMVYDPQQRRPTVPKTKYAKLRVELLESRN
jgi:hypothetical protein